jgi:hypothetical protein
MFLANGVTLQSMPIMPSTATDPWNWASWPSAEIEFYPRGTTSVTYDLHFSSLRLLRTAEDTLEATTHEQTTTLLSVVRRKSNTKLGAVIMPMRFYIKIE